MSDLQELLKREEKELLIKLAVLFELDSTVTAVMHVTKTDTAGFLVMASDTNNQALVTRQKSVEDLIQKKFFKTKDWRRFFAVCKIYRIKHKRNFEQDYFKEML